MPENAQARDEVPRCILSAQAESNAHKPANARDKRPIGIAQVSKHEWQRQRDGRKNTIEEHHRRQCPRASAAVVVGGFDNHVANASKHRMCDGEPCPAQAQNGNIPRDTVRVDDIDVPSCACCLVMAKTKERAAERSFRRADARPSGELYAPADGTDHLERHEWDERRAWDRREKALPHTRRMLARGFVDPALKLAALSIVKCFRAVRGEG